MEVSQYLKANSGVQMLIYFVMVTIVLILNFNFNLMFLLRTFAPNSSYGESFFISPLELVHKVLTPKMKKKIGVTDFVSEKMAVEKCLNFDKSVITTRCSLLCYSIENPKNKLLEWRFPFTGIRGGILR